MTDEGHFCYLCNSHRANIMEGIMTQKLLQLLIAMMELYRVLDRLEWRLDQLAEVIQSTNDELAKWGRL